jgi:hypothetical protein
MGLIPLQQALASINILLYVVIHAQGSAGQGTGGAATAASTAA